jgi:D-alanine-D-alanine ligase
MRVGILYDLFDDYPWRPGEPPDADAENEPEATLLALEAALRRLGHEPVRLGPPARLDPARLRSVDVGVNIAEGAHTRNREGWAPTLLEMAGVPFVGSDALTLSASLDKAWTKDLVAAAGVPTPAYRCWRRASDVDAGDLPGPWPLFVKPRYEGSAKGIAATSVVRDLPSLRAEVDRIAGGYGQDALVEPFLAGGGEYTVAVVGSNEPRALPVILRAVEATTGIGLHALEHRGAPHGEWSYRIEGGHDAALEAELQRLALLAFRKLECRDFARVDFRVDGAGTPWFLEINPLPTFAPDGTFAVVAELTGITYDAFLARVLGEAIARAVPALEVAP